MPRSWGACKRWDWLLTFPPIIHGTTKNEIKLITNKTKHTVDLLNQKKSYFQGIRSVFRRSKKQETPTNFPKIGRKTVTISAFPTNSVRIEMRTQIMIIKAQDGMKSRGCIIAAIQSANPAALKQQFHFVSNTPSKMLNNTCIAQLELKSNMLSFSYAYLWSSRQNVRAHHDNYQVPGKPFAHVGSPLDQRDIFAFFPQQLQISRPYEHNQTHSDGHRAVGNVPKPKQTVDLWFNDRSF